MRYPHNIIELIKVVLDGRKRVKQAQSDLNEAREQLKRLKCQLH